MQAPYVPAALVRLLVRPVAWLARRRGLDGHYRRFRGHHAPCWAQVCRHARHRGPAGSGIKPGRGGPGPGQTVTGGVEQRRRRPELQGARRTALLPAPPERRRQDHDPIHPHLHLGHDRRGGPMQAGTWRRRKHSCGGRSASSSRALPRPRPDRPGARPRPGHVLRPLSGAAAVPPDAAAIPPTGRRGGGRPRRRGRTGAPGANAVGGTRRKLQSVHALMHRPRMLSWTSPRRASSPEPP